MALIKCNECGKEVSDKATACPGCGCPVRFAYTTSGPVLSNDVFIAIIRRFGSENDRLLKLVTVCSGNVVGNAVNALCACRAPNNDKLLGYVDLTIFGSAKDAICFTDHGIYYKFQGDLIRIPYSEIVNHTFDYKYENAWIKVLKNNEKFCEIFIKDELSMLGLVLDAIREEFDNGALAQQPQNIEHEPPVSTSNSSHTQCPNCFREIAVGAEVCIECNYVLSDKELEAGRKSSLTYASGSSSRPSYNAETNGGRMPEIPTGLYIATATLGFPLGTCIAIAANISQKAMIKRGDYERANKSIKLQSILCWLILIPSAIATIFISSIILTGYGVVGGFVIAVVLGIALFIMRSIIK